MSSPPMVKIAYPLTGSTVKKGKIDVGIVSQDDTGLHSFTLLVNQMLEDLTEAGDAKWPDTLVWNARRFHPGPWNLTVIVEDIDGFTGQDSVDVTLIK